MQSAIEFLNGVTSDAKSLKRKLVRLAKLQAKLDSFGVPQVRKANGKATVKAAPAVANPARQLQGKYMGLVRALPEAQKAHVKVVKEQKGMRAAIAEAKRLRKAAQAAA